MSRRVTGFSRTAKSYVEQHPGKTAQEIVRYLLGTGAVQSAALEPEGSLVATLHKHHIQLGLERRYDNGTYRYYPKNGHSPPPPAPPKMAIGDTSGSDRVLVTVWLSHAATIAADTLIASGTCKDRSEAVNWLVNRAVSGIVRQ